MRKIVGFILNPISGMGGSVGLKGTDGSIILEQAIALGAKPLAADRAIAALGPLKNFASSLEFVGFDGLMGGDVVSREGFSFTPVGQPTSMTTSEEDTRQALGAIVSHAPDLIMFAGGDGTARIIQSVKGTSIPVIGIPTGVKMHSSAFAITPRAAGHIAAMLVSDQIDSLALADIVDLDEESYRQGYVMTQLFGHMMVPVARNLIQSPKIPTKGEKEYARLIGNQVIENFKTGVLYILGPGTTTNAITDLLKVDGSLIGVDVLLNRELIAKDATEQCLLTLLQKNYSAEIIVTPIGGQGVLLGRGNQQISARVVEQVGIKNLTVIATPSKIASLGGRPFLMDIGDTKLEKAMPAFFQVISGWKSTTMYPYRTE